MSGTDKKSEEQPSLVALVCRQMQLMEQVLENEGEIAEDLEVAIRLNSDGLATKVDSYSYVIDELDFRAEFFRSKARAISAAAKTLETKAEHLRDRLRNALETTRVPLTGYEVEFALGKPSISYDLAENVSIEDIPEKFIRLKKELDKERLKVEWDWLGSELQMKFKRIEKSRINSRIPTPKRKDG